MTPWVGESAPRNMKVLISTSSFGTADRSPIDALERHGFEVALTPFRRPLKEQEIGELLGDVDVLVAGTEPLTGVVFDRASRLKAISRVGVGLDNVDQPYDGPLRELPPVILTSHIGSYATEVRTCMELEAVQNVLCWLRQMGETQHGL